MIHFFQTRLAIDRGDLLGGRQAPVGNEHIAFLAKIWLEKASMFYERQTVKAEFQVILLCNERYRPLLSALKFPAWAHLCYDYHSQRRPLYWLDEVGATGKQATITRLDADDSYALDFFEFLGGLGARSEEQLFVLHKLFKQYDARNRQLSEEMGCPSPHFATMYFRRIPDWHAVPAAQLESTFRGAMGNHGYYHKYSHIDSGPKCYALERITGRNLGNRRGCILGRKVDARFASELDPRFVGY